MIKISFLIEGELPKQEKARIWYCAMLLGEKALPITILRDLMGHSDSKITVIYLQAVGAEKRNMVMNAWQ